MSKHKIMKKKANNHAFIDGQNLYLGIKSLGWELDYKRFAVYLKEKYAVKKAYLFLGYIKEQESLYQYLRSCGFEIVFKEIAKDANGKPKGNVDVDLTLHTILKVSEYEQAVLVTSDGDFAPLVEHLLLVNKLNIMRWGLIPFWAKDEKIGYKLINARAETVFDKPTWKKPVLKQRCLVPTNGFYEWKKEEDGKQPYYIGLKDRSLFAFAGVYDSWTNKTTGEIVDTFSILTTEPNKEMSKIHVRMPVILRRDAENEWLDPTRDKPDELEEFLLPYDDNSLEIYPVSKDVGNARNDDKKLIQALS